MENEIKEILLENIIPFKHHSGQIYDGERLVQPMNSLENIGLLNPIIVRPAENGKYEIICGHDHVKALKVLGHTTVRAEIRYGLSDAMALELFFDSNLNQQSFSDWNYSQRIDAVRYIEELIRENSIQGKRTDLQRENDTETENGTCVQNRQKLKKTARKTTTRDKMARRLGISTATLSKYRRIIKLPDELIQSIAQMLDGGRISLDTAYRISGLRDSDIKWLLEGMEKRPDTIINLDKLKKLPGKKDDKPGIILPISKRQVLAVLKAAPSSDVIPVVRHKKR